MGSDGYKSEYLSVNLGDYPNIGINFQISTLLFIILLVVIISTIIINYRKYCSIKFIKKLVRYKNVGENKARELYSFRLKKNVMRVALSCDRIYRLISFVGKKEIPHEDYIPKNVNEKTKEKIKAKNKTKKIKRSKDFKIDYKKSMVFIKEDMYEDAYDISEENIPTVLSTVLFCILMISLFVCAVLALPELLNFINNLMNK